MPEATPHDRRRPSTDPAHAYDADPDEETMLRLWEESEEDLGRYYELMVEAGYARAAYPIPSPPTSGSSRPVTPVKQEPVEMP